MSSKEKKTQEVVGFKRDPKKFYNDSLNILVGFFKGLPQKSPIAYELSRATKLVQERLESFEESKSLLMESYLLRTEKGEYQLSKEAEEEIEKAKVLGSQVRLTVFSFVIENPDLVDEYREKMLDLLNQEVELKFRKVNASTKNISLETGERVRLIDCISNFFESGQINFLESIGILEGLD